MTDVKAAPVEVGQVLWVIYNHDLGPVEREVARIEEWTIAVFVPPKGEGFDRQTLMRAGENDRGLVASNGYHVYFYEDEKSAWRGEISHYENKFQSAKTSLERVKAGYEKWANRSKETA